MRQPGAGRASWARLWPAIKRAAQHHQMAEGDGLLSDHSDSLGVTKGHWRDLVSNARAVLEYSAECGGHRTAAL
jgi:hypothetical protein